MWLIITVVVISLILFVLGIICSVIEAKDPTFVFFIISYTLIIFAVASNVRHKQNTEKVYAEYEVVDKFTTIKKGEVYYYVELVYIDDYELYDDKDQNIIHELKRYSDYKYHNKGSVIKIEIKVVIPK